MKILTSILAERQAQLRHHQSLVADLTKQIKELKVAIAANKPKAKPSPKPATKKPSTAGRK